MDMNNVIISEQGIIDNLLSLNYTDITMVFEHLNNVVNKNKNPEYNISFSLKKNRKNYMFTFEDNNSVGFSSLHELKRAYSIADSDRSGANNTGHGIFSPITVDSTDCAINLFIQSNENGNFYSFLKYNSKTKSIKTSQGVFKDKIINGVDISSLINDGGTRTFWSSGSVLPRKTEAIIQHFIIDDSYKPVDSDIIEALEQDIGKRYFHFIQKGIKINYENNPIQGIDILQYGFHDIERRFEKKYEIRINFDDKDKSKKFIIREPSGENIWKTFTKNSKNPFGKEAGRDTRSKKQIAQLEIYDLQFETEDNRSLISRQDDRKIWVEIDNIRIFCEEFSMNQWPKIRVILKLKNENDNAFDKFITPNANKSNSKINDELKAYITNLIKYTSKTYFAEKLGLSTGTNITRKDAWIKTFGIDGKFQQICTNDNCILNINPFEFCINCDDKPVCKECK